MEIIDLAEKRKAFLRSEDRYEHPHKQAMKLRLLWTNDKAPNKHRDMKEVRNLYKEASKLIGDEQKFQNVSQLIGRGLKLDPRFHAFHALKGDLSMRQGKRTEAIKCYESARRTAKFDKSLAEALIETLYNRQLVESYRKRGDWFNDNELLLEAAADYEQILILRLPEMSVTDVEDKLLAILRQLNKYEAFRCCWNDFVKGANDRRLSDLLTKDAEFKIHLREIAAARKILFEALALDKENAKAKELLQVVYRTGDRMAAYTVIWCMHGCYDKALLTIEKGRECEPRNPGFALLKTIVLRASGRLDEALSWLREVDQRFRVFEESGSIVGRLSIEETRRGLIEQWYLVRQEMAVRCVLENRHEEATKIILGSNLTKRYAEAHLLLGDSLWKRGRTEEALETYLRGREFSRELNPTGSVRSIDLTERAIDILNSRANAEIRLGHAKSAIETSETVLRLLDEERVDACRFRAQRGNAMLNISRGHFRLASGKGDERKLCREFAADSLRYFRGAKGHDLYRALYGEMGMEEVIDRFAPKRTLPHSLKILMQYS